MQLLLKLALSLLILSTLLGCGGSVQAVFSPDYSEFPAPSTATIGSKPDFGNTVNDIGDINGDGFEEFVVSAPLATVSGHFQTGLLFVIWGRLTTRPATTSSQTTWPSFSSLPNISLGLVISGAHSNETAGNSFTGGCDVNGDEIDDLLIQSSNPSAVYVVFGRHTGWPDTLVLTNMNGTNGFVIVPSSSSSLQWSQSFGSAMSCAGDIDGDHYDDLMIGDHKAHTAGCAVLLYGRNPWSAVVTVSSTASFGGVIFNSSTTENLGKTMTSLDLNLDGHTDLVICATGTTASEGQVNVIWGGDSTKQLLKSGSIVPLPITSSRDGCYFSGPLGSDSQWGTAIATGDVNGDNHNDLLFSTSEAAQTVFVVLSSSSTSWQLGMSSPSIAIVYATPSQGFGHSIACGDFNNDGADDVLVGAEKTGGYKGMLVVIMGSSMSSTTISLDSTSVPDGKSWWKTTGSIDSMQLGWSVGVVRGVTGGEPDKLITGTPSVSPAGRVWMYSDLKSQGTQCFVGYGLNSATGACTTCVTGHSFSDGTTPCSPTATASACTLFTQAGTCVKCGPGTALVLGECLECAANSTWVNNPAVNCTAAPRVVTHCNAGHGFDGSSRTCTACKGESNQWSNGTTTCQLGPDHCGSCNATTGVCNTCTTSYTLRTVASGHKVCILSKWQGDTQQVEITVNTTGLNVTQLIQDIAVQLQISQALITVVLTSDPTIIKITVPTSVVDSLNKLNQIPNVVSVRVLTTSATSLAISTSPLAVVSFLLAIITLVLL